MSRSFKLWEQDIIDQLKTIKYSLDGKFSKKKDDKEIEISKEDVDDLLSKIIVDNKERKDAGSSQLFNLIASYLREGVWFSLFALRDDVPPFGYVVRCVDKAATLEDGKPIGGTGGFQDYEIFYGGEAIVGLQEFELEADVNNVMLYFNTRQLLKHGNYFEFKNLRPINDVNGEPVDIVIVGGKDDSFCLTRNVEIYKNGKIMGYIQKLRAWVGVEPDAASNKTVRIDITRIKTDKDNPDPRRRIVTYIESYVGTCEGSPWDRAQVSGGSFSVSDEDFMVVIIDGMLDDNKSDDDIKASVKNILKKDIPDDKIQQFIDAARKDENRTQTIIP